jgi:hypothetical protein
LSSPGKAEASETTAQYLKGIEAIIIYYSTTATIQEPSTNQMRLIYSINQSDAFDILN